MPLFVADEKGLMRDGAVIGAPCFALDARGVYVCAAGHKRGERVETGGAIESFAVPPSTTRVCVRERVYLLSSDADSVTALDSDLRMAFSAPCGDFPRDLCMSDDGRRLLVAGGASGTAILMDDSLRVLREYRLFGVVSAVCLTGEGIAALCAYPSDGLTSALVLVRSSGVCETLLTLEGAPCALCALRDGTLLVGVTGEIVCARGKRIIYRLPFGCPCRIRPCGRGALVTDVCDGTLTRIKRPPGEIVYRGQPHDAILT